MALSRHEKLVVTITLLHIVAAREILNNSLTMDLAVLLFLVTYVMAMGFLGYVCIIADPSKSRLANLFTVEGPAKIQKLVSDWIGEENANRISALADRFLYVMYMVIVFGSWGAIFFFTYPWVDASEGYISSYHKIVGYIIFVVCVTSWRFASKQSPGIITAQTLEKFDNYPYDDLLFPKDRICPTVGIRKLARSKYDRFSGVHVAKFDHFCGWLGNPIGEENYRWFLLFLVVHAGMLIYGTVIVAYLFQHEIEKNKLWEKKYFNLANLEELSASPYIIFQYLFQKHILHSGLLLLFGVMSIVMLLFLGYHVWITSRGMTTNEASKWAQVIKWYRIELKRYQKALKEGSLVDESTGTVPGISDGDVTCTGATGDVKDISETEKVFNPGPKPKFMYNNGFVENWRDVIFPRSMRKEAIERHRSAIANRARQEIDQNKKMK